MIRIFKVSHDTYIGADNVVDAMNFCKIKHIKTLKKKEIKEASMDSKFFNESLGLISFRDQLIIDLKNKDLRVPYIFALGELIEETEIIEEGNS